MDRHPSERRGSRRDLPPSSFWRTSRRRLAQLAPPVVALTCLLTATVGPVAESAAQGSTASPPPMAPAPTTIHVPARDPVGIAAAGGRMWVTDAGAGEVLEIDASSGSLIRRFKLALTAPRGLAFDGERLWIADQATHQLVAHRAADGQKARAITLQGLDEKKGQTVEALGWDGKDLWAVLVGGGSRTFNQVEAGTGRILRSVSADCDPRGIAFNVTLLFALCVHRDRELAAVDRRLAAAPESEMLKSRQVVRVLPAIMATGLAHDGTRLWVLDGKGRQATAVGVGPARPLQQQQTPICAVTPLGDVSWNVCLFWAEDKGIWIASADIKRTPAAPWIRVLSETGPVEILTTYHGSGSASPLHIFDMGRWSCVDPVTSTDTVAGSLLLTIPTNYPPGFCPPTGVPNVVREVRDRGVASLCKGSTSYIRRGKEVVYWSVYDTGNYDYIVEYGFRDDGRITLRVGATGYNNPGRPLEAHVHTALWRINADIDGATNNVFIDTHAEPSPPMSLTIPISAATDSSQPVTYESFFDFDPVAFTTLRVEATTGQTTSGHPLAYVLHPLAQGTSRHYNIAPVWPQHSEVFAQHDFAVTKSNPGELSFTIGSPSIGTEPPPDDYLLPQLGYPGTAGQAPEPLVNTDVVLWHRAALHHAPSDEDRPNWPGLTSPGDGITLMHWMGFDFVPHNFFDANPFSGSRACSPWCGNGVCDTPVEDGCSCPVDCGANTC